MCLITVVNDSTLPRSRTGLRMRHGVEVSNKQIDGHRQISGVGTEGTEVLAKKLFGLESDCERMPNTPSRPRIKRTPWGAARLQAFHQAEIGLEAAP